MQRSDCALGSAHCVWTNDDFHLLGRIFASLKRARKAGADTFTGRDAPMCIPSDFTQNDSKQLPRAQAN